MRHHVTACMTAPFNFVTSADRGRSLTPFRPRFRNFRFDRYPVESLERAADVNRNETHPPSAPWGLHTAAPILDPAEAAATNSLLARRRAKARVREGNQTTSAGTPHPAAPAVDAQAAIQQPAGQLSEERKRKRRSRTPVRESKKRREH